MDIKTVLEELEHRFLADYPEFYNRRIIIWLDPDKEFEDIIDEVDINNVKVLKMSNYNKFQVKKVLCCDDIESDYLLYCPILFEKNEDNWITDIFKYSEIFRADRISIEITEMGLQDTASIRREMKKYKKFFNAKKRRDSVAKLSYQIGNSPEKLTLAIMASIAKCEMTPEKIIRSVIIHGMEKENNDIYQEFIHYDLEDMFWELCLQGTGYSQSETEISDLFLHILLTASSREIDKKTFIGLEDWIDDVHDSFCFQFIDNWIHDSKDNEQFKLLSRKIENDLHIYHRLLNVEIDNFKHAESFLAIDEAILTKVMEDISNNIIDPIELINVIRERRVKAWYQDFKYYYEGIYYLAKIQEFYNEHQSSFHEISAYQLWQLYANDFYKMDTYYRKFQTAFQNSLNHTNIRLDDLFKSIMKKIEAIYKHWFLDGLLSNWCNIAGEALQQYGHIPQIPQQTDFYEHYIKPSKTKVFVIISDALRYEVAKELSDDLAQERQAKVEINNMEGIFPTITSFGMAALLPKNQLTIENNNGKLTVLADAIPTSANYREQILKKANEASTVIKYEDLLQMKRNERKEKVKGMEVVYIYHNRIDESGHGNGSDIFPACQIAMNELKNIINIIVNDFSGVNIMITADHGFLYTYEPLSETDKVDKVGFEGAIEVGRRYAIMDNKATPQFLMPIKLIDNMSSCSGFAPRENIRIKKQGGGINFVHGGISIQEMMVPVISYRHLRNSSKEYQNNKEKIDVKPVQLKLLSTGRKISNMMFNLSFYQSEMISKNRKATNFTLYFIDEYGNKVSDEARIIADKNNNTDDTDRRFDVRFNLKVGKYNNKQPYYLIINEESGELVPEKIEFTIDIPFSTGEYDFFN